LLRLLFVRLPDNPKTSTKSCGKNLTLAAIIERKV